MMAFEQRWARQLLSAFAPSGGPGLAPLHDEVDYVGVVARMRREATPLAAFGLRIAIWIAALAPLWLWGKLTTISKLAADRRTDLLRELLAHRAFVVRELATLLKLTAAMALLGTPTVRARSGYDHGAAIAEAGVESGLRVRLPVVAGEQPALRVWPGSDGSRTDVELPRAHPSEAP
jgi:hypothetical protein